jgi:hypothetical protein
MRKLLALAAVLVLFASCSKKDAASNTNIQGRWDLDRVVETYVFSGQTDTDEWSYPGDYFEFKSGGSFVGQYDGDPISGTWSLTDGGSKLVVTNSANGTSETTTIKTITSSSLVITSKEGTASDYLETTLHLSK